MEYLKVAGTAVFSMLVLFCFAKLIGYRQISELSSFDYINGITIGSIAAELTTAEGTDFFRWLIALAVFGTLSYVLAVASDKSIGIRRAVTGVPLFLMKGGKLFDGNFKIGKIDLNEFLMICRAAGYFRLSELDTAVLEPNGKISFLPRSESRPLTPADMQLSPEPAGADGNVILDGVVMEKNLAACGRDKNWLRAEMKRQKVSSPSEVFLGVCTPSGQLSLYLRHGKAKSAIFE